MNTTTIYIIKRIAAYLLTLYVAVTFCFLLFRIVPGNPIGTSVQRMMRTYYWRAEQAKAVIDEYRKIFGLEKDLFTQYVNFLKELILHGNLGPSFIGFPKKVQELIMFRLPWTIGLLGITTVISWILGNLIGAFVGWRQGSKLDKTLSVLALGFSQVPFYITGVLMALIFGYFLAWLPARGAYSPDLTPGPTLEFITSVIKHAILPALSIMISSFFGWIISMRSLLVSILGEDYLIFAEAKGLKKNRIFFTYAMRNCMLPQVTGLAIQLGFIMSGAVLVETIFNYPGVGSLFQAAISNLDYNTTVGCLIITIFAVLTANLILDLLLPLLDPRIKYGG